MGWLNMFLGPRFHSPRANFSQAAQGLRVQARKAGHRARSCLNFTMPRRHIKPVPQRNPSIMTFTDRSPSGTGQQPGLAHIPVIESGRDFPLVTLAHQKSRAHALLDLATRRYPRQALSALDAVSRAWLVRWENAHLAEIDKVAGMLGRPGAYFFSVNYEWGCTCRAAPSPDGTSARLIRVLDWLTPGLGRNIVAVRVSGAPAGPFVTLTWPGYTGVLQVMAQGRFSASLNQAPMRSTSGFYYLDWAANKKRVWSMPHPTPAHLLREVSERAETFGEAMRMLREHPISTPAIFTLAGLDPSQTAVIERSETDGRVREGAAVAANHWETAGWQGRARGNDSAGRARMMSAIAPDFDPEFGWLRAPILNNRTRLALVADAQEGRLVARGYEAGGAATQTLVLNSPAVR
jgi:hypothetical protein